MCLICRIALCHTLTKSFVQVSDLEVAIYIARTCPKTFYHGDFFLHVCGWLLFVGLLAAILNDSCEHYAILELLFLSLVSIFLV